MDNSSTTLRLATTPVVADVITQVLRDGARRMLQKAIEDEVADYAFALICPTRSGPWTSPTFPPTRAGCTWRG